MTLLSTATRELAVILGDGIAIAGGNLRRIRIANLAALVVIELAANLQFQRIDVGDKLLMHLLDKPRVAGKRLGSRLRI